LTDLFAMFEAMPWLEFLGLASGLACVWLLIRQNIWTFPIGLVYALISVVVFFDNRLYADVLLNGYYVLMNGYGWYYWRYGGPKAADDQVPVRVATGAVQGTVGVVILAGTALMGWTFASQTDADLPYWNSATTVMSFAAMWLTARKYLDSWILWLVVDVVAAGIYLYKGILFYAVLYSIYLVMAVMGWRAWKQSLERVSSSA
jgi:nicotinamide mononucleotide transporter